MRRGNSAADAGRRSAGEASLVQTQQRHHLAASSPRAARAVHGAAGDRQPRSAAEQGPLLGLLLPTEDPEFRVLPKVLRRQEHAGGPKALPPLSLLPGSALLL